MPVQNCPLSQQTGLNRGIKGVKTRLYVDFGKCHQVSIDPETGAITWAAGNRYTEVCCLRAITPPGAERATETDDGCMGEDFTFNDLGPITFTNMTVTFRDDMTARCHEEMSVAFRDNLIVAIVIEHPTSDGSFMYEHFDARIASFVPGEITKNDYKESTITFTPTSGSYCRVDVLGAIGTDCLADAKTLGAGWPLPEVISEE